MKHAKSKNPALDAYNAGAELLNQHPIFHGWASGGLRRDGVLGHGPGLLHPAGWLHSLYCGPVLVHPKLLLPPTTWAYAMARMALVCGMNLFQTDKAHWPEWSAACDVVTARFLAQIKLFTCEMQLPEGLPGWDEARWYQSFCEDGIPAWAAALSLAGPHQPSLGLADEALLNQFSYPRSYSENASVEFAAGLSRSVSVAVEVAAGVRTSMSDATTRARAKPMSAPLQRAISWFMASFPLLGAMVAAFDFIEDGDTCRREDISVAAVNERLRTIWLNPAAGLGEMQMRFVIAHEILHVALRHQVRRQGRDPFLWNVACDYVINAWLIEMDVGHPPELGLLHDPQLKGLSAESVYDRIAKDLRRARKLRTFAGAQCDMLDRDLNATRPPMTDLDSFYREQLAKGVMLHEQREGRGLLPAGLMEEIKALLQPPIDWEVELAHWFDAQFPPIATRRSWAQMSRRQSATPDIPRARVVVDPALREGRTFGVVLDTSGSMNHGTLARALGAIASYAQAKEVPLARLICCDAEAHDLGYLAPEQLAGRVTLRGRGGTVLQPGIALLDKAADFPTNGPVLVITDGACDHLRIQREHAFLLPPGRRLPFSTRAPVFHMSV